MLSTAVVPPDSVEPQELLVRTAPVGYDVLTEERAALIAEIEHALPEEIVSPPEYSAVATLEARLGTYLQKIEPLFDGDDGSVTLGHRAWKAACRVREFFYDGPKALKARCKRLRGDYEQREERARRERERQIAEQAMQEEKARLQREAKLLEKQGQKDMAAAVRQTPITAPAVALPRAVPDVRATGVSSTRKNWTWRIAGSRDIFGGKKDKDARQRAAKLVPREFLDLNDAAITAYVKSQRSSARIPGLEVFEEKV